MKKNTILLLASFLLASHHLRAQEVIPQACCNEVCLTGWFACNAGVLDNKVRYTLENPECANYVTNTCWTITGGKFKQGNNFVTSVCNGINNELWVFPDNEEEQQYPVEITVTITFSNGWPPITVSRVFWCGDEFTECEFQGCPIIPVEPNFACCDDICLWGWMACIEEADLDNKVNLQFENPECRNYVANTCWTIQGGTFRDDKGNMLTSLCNGISDALWFEPTNPELPLTITVTVTFANGWPPITVSQVFRCGDEIDPCVFEDCTTVTPDPPSYSCCNDACLWGWMACAPDEPGDPGLNNRVHLQLENQECWNYVTNTCWTISGGTFYGDNGVPVTSLCNGVNSAWWFEPINEELPLTITVTITFANNWPPITISRVFRCGMDIDPCTFPECTPIDVREDAHSDSGRENEGDLVVKVYPNPAVDGRIFVQISNSDTSLLANGDFHIALIDLVSSAKIWEYNTNRDNFNAGGTIAINIPQQYSNRSAVLTIQTSRGLQNIPIQVIGR